MKSKRRRYFQEPLFDEFRSDTCYVCCRRIPKLKGVCVGQGLWRHQGCKPGSRRWAGSGLDERVARAHGER